MIIAVGSETYIMCEKHDFGGYTPHLFNDHTDFRSWLDQQSPRPYMVSRNLAHGRWYQAKDHRNESFDQPCTHPVANPSVTRSRYRFKFSQWYLNPK